MAPRDMDAELGSSKNHGAEANGSGGGAAGGDGGSGRGAGNDSSSAEVEASRHGSKRRRKEERSSRGHRDRDLDEQEHSNRRRHQHRHHGSSRHSRRNRHRTSRSRSRSPSSDGERIGRDREGADDGDGRSSRKRSSSRRSDSKSRKRRRSRSGSPSDGKRKSKSKSRSRSPQRSRSRSRSESKRASGFDVMPAGSFSSSQAGVMMQPTSMTQQATRHARRVYVGGLPPLVNEQAIAAFFNQVMASVGGNSAGPGDAVVNVYINQEKRFAFVEMRSVEEASNAIALNGIFFNGIPVRVKRPSDYDREMAARLGPVDPSPHLNLASVGLEYRSLGPADGPDRIFVGGLPYDWGEQDIRNIMEGFGPLRGLEIVKDSTTGTSKGYGFVVFQDATITDSVCELLNSTRIGDKVLTVRRATVNGTTKGDLTPGSGQQTHQQQRQTQHQPEQETDIPTRVVCLANAVSREELKNDAEYGEIVEDMMEECGKFGELERVEIPRPAASGAPVPGQGKVFLEYKDVRAAIRAKCNLGGRKFAGKTVETRYYPESRFAAKDYSL